MKTASLTKPKKPIVRKTRKVALKTVPSTEEGQVTVDIVPTVTTPPPSLDTCIGPIYITFVDVPGGDLVVSDYPTHIPLAKRLAMAYAEVTKTGSSFIGIGSNIMEAFQVVSFDSKGQHVVVRIKNCAEQVRLSTFDPKYTSSMKERRFEEKPSPVAGVEATTIKYNLLRRMSRHGDCPHCGCFIGSSALRYEETDVGQRRITNCPECSTIMKGYY